jgi:hypothetical protein
MNILSTPTVPAGHDSLTLLRRADWGPTGICAW